MKKYFLFILLSSPLLLRSQSLRLISNLPSFLNENSGIVVKSNNSIWTHNDSGDGPIIYNIDSNGNQLDSIYLNGVTAIDFEDITEDNQGNIYIGDFGNNSHNRTNLVIYKIPNPDSISGNNVTPEVLFFNYPDQLQFPDPNQDKDCEALFHFNGSLFILTKNWGSSGYSKLYQLPDTAGTYSALLLDSIKTTLVTGADIHPSGILAILSMDRVVILDQFVGNDFFNGRESTFHFSLTQKEGVSFLDSNTLYITQEHHSFFPGAKLYELKFSPFLSAVSIKRSPDLQAMPNPASEFLTILIKDLNRIPPSLSYEIYSMDGKMIRETEMEFTSEFVVFLSDFKPGIYLMKVNLGNYSLTKRFIKN